VSATLKNMHAYRSRELYGHFTSMKVYRAPLQE
jgi:hypothetical protein